MCCFSLGIVQKMNAHVSTPFTFPIDYISTAAVRIPEEHLLVMLKSAPGVFIITEYLTSFAIKYSEGKIISYSGSTADNTGVSLGKKTPFDPQVLQDSMPFLLSQNNHVLTSRALNQLESFWPEAQSPWLSRGTLSPG